MMTTPTNDFDAAKAIVDQLKDMEKDRQERILRWVAESLSLTVQVKVPPANARLPATHSDPSPAETLGTTPVEHHSRRITDIKTFVDEKKPKSDMQFAAVVAYYYKFEARAGDRKETINSEVLQDAARLAGHRRFVKPLMTLNNAKNYGYLDSSERGEFGINSVGENLVAMTLPGTGGEARGRQNSGKQKPKRRRTKG